MKRSLVCKRDFIYLCSALRFDSSLKSTRFPWDDETLYKTPRNVERFNSHLWIPSIKKMISADLVGGGRGVSFWPEEELKISERFQDVFKKIVYVYSEKTCTKFNVTANYTALSFKKSSVKHPPQYLRMLPSLLLNLKTCFTLLL